MKCLALVDIGCRYLKLALPVELSTELHPGLYDFPPFIPFRESGKSLFQGEDS